MKKGSWVAVAVLAVLVAGAGWYWWQGRTPTPVATRSEAPAPKVADATPPTPAPAASEPRIRHPIDAAEPEKTPTPLQPEALLVDLFGRKAVLSMFQLDDFPRRFACAKQLFGKLVDFGDGACEIGKRFAHGRGGGRRRDDRFRHANRSGGEGH